MGWHGVKRKMFPSKEGKKKAKGKKDPQKARLKTLSVIYFELPPESF